MSRNEHDFRQRSEQSGRKTKRQEPGRESSRSQNSRGGQRPADRTQNNRKGQRTADRTQRNRKEQRTENRTQINRKEQRTENRTQINRGGQSAARRKRRRRNQVKRLLLSAVLLCIIAACGIGGFMIYRKKAAARIMYASLFETEHYNQSIYQGELFAPELCVTAGDVVLNGFEGDPTLHAAGLFDVNQKQVLYADRVHDQLYPASTTKLMTAYLALKYGNLEDIVTVSTTAVSFVDPEASVCGLQAGDQLTLYDLLCGLILQSGNDNAVVIAEYLGGSVEEFVNMMNSEALALGATRTHFVNPHGLHDDNHYTTAYDLYLIFNACIKDQRFLDIIAMKTYQASITSADGSTRNDEWSASNYYSSGLAEPPAGINVIGGKTGTTDQAGSCVILYNLDSAGNPLISVVMGASEKELLYNDTSRLLFAGTGG